MPDGRLGEVISVVARRRRWTLEEKVALVDEVLRPGASVAGVADRHGVSRSLLFDWRRQLREGMMPGVVHAQNVAGLVPVRVVEELPRKAAPRPQEPSRKSAERPNRVAEMIEVVLNNGRMLRVRETIPPRRLGQLAAALEG